jgi:hypothetical protein
MRSPDMVVQATSAIVLPACDHVAFLLLAESHHHAEHSLCAFT